MKVGVYASMFGKDDPPRLESVESYIQLAYQLKLDVDRFPTACADFGRSSWRTCSR